MNELERSLVASWSLDTLAVYADHLQRLGDPRGELMALDLSPAPEDKAWRAQRQALLVAWLGESLAARAGHLVQHGFLHASRQDRFHPPDLLDGPQGAFVRSHTLLGFEADLARFASQQRPWLTGLTLLNVPNVLFSDTVRDALIAAAPNLQEVLFLGRPAFNAFMHPTLRRVYVERGPRVHHHPFTVAVPEGVEVRELYPSGDARGPSLRIAEVVLALDAVDETPDCGQLQARYGALFTDGYSLPALLLWLRSAGLITLDGPIARLTEPGDVLRSKGPHGTPRTPPPEVDAARWMLWVEAVGDRFADRVGLLIHNLRLIDKSLSLAPLGQEVQDVLVAWRYFLQRVAAAGESELLAFDAPGPLAQAVETLLELWDLLGPARIWEETEVSVLRHLQHVLGPPLAPRNVRFHAVRGM